MTLRQVFLNGVPVWWREMSSVGWMGFQLFQKLKGLRKKIFVWKKEVFGLVEEKEISDSRDIACLDLKEESDDLTEEESRQRMMLRKNLNKRLIKRRLSGNKDLGFGGWMMGIEIPSSSMG